MNNQIDLDWSAQFRIKCIPAPCGLKFEPFTSIEDNQEQAMEQKAYQKQDNSWHERGELPPVGARVDVDGDDLVYGRGEKSCEVLAHVEDTAVIRMSYGLGCFQSGALSPSRTEREKAMIDMFECVKQWSYKGDQSERLGLFGAIYDAGYRKETK